MPSADTQRLVKGVALAALIAVVIVALLALIGLAAGPSAARTLDVPHLLRMTSIQAGTTAVLSLFIGVALAWSLNRLRFPGRNIFVALLSTALVMPGLVVAIGIISVWGRSGWINSWLQPLGLQTGSVFGFGGIIYAHVLLDATFAAAVFLARLQAIPSNRLRLGRNLRMNPIQRFAIIDWPTMAPAIPGLAAIIFLLAFTSFPIVLTLGGGPANETLEVAIYAAVRLDFDLAAAVALAITQIVVCGLVLIPATLFAPPLLGAGNTRTIFWPESKTITALAVIVSASAAVAFSLPLLAVLWDGFGSIGDVFSQAAFWRACATSLFIAAVSSALVLAASRLLAQARSATQSRWLRAALSAPTFVYLAIPGVTLALGFFLAARALGLPAFAAAPVVLIFANTLLALPYALATMSPALDTISARYARLSTSLRLSSRTRWRFVEWPLLGREIGLVLAMGFCFSLGDLTVISLFGTEDFTTLPWLMNRALGAYRTNDAAAIAAITLIVCIAVFLLTPKFSEKLANADR